MQRFTSAFEETKRELEGMSSDMDANLSLQLASKLNTEDLPQKLQEASLVSRASLQAQVKQVSYQKAPFFKPFHTKLCLECSWVSCTFAFTKHRDPQHCTCIVGKARKWCIGHDVEPLYIVCDLLRNTPVSKCFDYGGKKTCRGS